MTETAVKRTAAEVWEALKETLVEVGKDVERNVEKHNVSAGVRVRKGMRQMRTLATELIRSTVVEDKELTTARRAAKESGTPSATPKAVAMPTVETKVAKTTKKAKAAKTA